MKIIHHKDDAGFDAEITIKQRVKNPNYAGNIFQVAWWLTSTKKLIKNAHLLMSLKNQR